MTAQPGGMSAVILRAHNIAAAKVRRQSLEICSGRGFLPGATSGSTINPATSDYFRASGAAEIESADADEAEPMSRTKRPSVAEAAINWFPVSRERKAERAPSALGPSICPQVLPPSRERNRDPWAVEITTALRTGARSSMESSDRLA